MGISIRYRIKVILERLLDCWSSQRQTSIYVGVIQKRWLNIKIERLHMDKLILSEYMIGKDAVNSICEAIEEYQESVREYSESLD